MNEEIALGSKVKDTVTGMVGTLTARCKYFKSATQVGVEPFAPQNTTMQWMDE